MPKPWKWTAKTILATFCPHPAKWTSLLPPCLQNLCWGIYLQSEWCLGVSDSLDKFQAPASRANSPCRTPPQGCVTPRGSPKPGHRGRIISCWENREHRERGAVIRAVSHPQVQSPAPWPCRSEQVCAPTARSDAARGCCRAQISARVPRSEPWTLPWRFPYKQVPPYTTMGHQTAPQLWGHTALGLKQAEDGKFGGMAQKWSHFVPRLIPLQLTSPTDRKASLAQTGNTTHNIRAMKSETTKSKVYKSKTCWVINNCSARE